MYVAGDWASHNESTRIAVENPASEAVIGHIPEGTPADADAAVTAAQAAFPAWAVMPAIERAAFVTALADAMTADAERLAMLVTAEQGKPIVQARGEIAAAITFLRYAAEQARRIQGDIIASDNAREEIQIRKHPVGVVVGLTAWNYPSALVTRKLGPALVAGNTFILLSHEITPFSGLAVAELAERVGFPKGVFNVVTGRGPVVGQRLVEHPGTDLITMTGSTRAGRDICRTAADELKIVRLELGGKAPFIVMEDADIDAAVAAAMTARYTNCGQVCTCNERMYLHANIADQFLEKFVAKSRALTIGDPVGDVDLGPKVSGIEVSKIEEIVARGEAAGADILLKGGALNDGPYAKGHWVAPTVLEVTDNASPLLQEEIFGPVIAAKRVSDFDEAVSLANDTSFGLSAYMFTQNARQIAQTPYVLKFGEIYINRSSGEAVQGFHTGWGHSGLGGEDGQYGFDAYLKKQTTYLNWG
ncbi:MAG: aldehyde dehydrogenase family protein [Boseongicola sp.]|nr:MAG: aldehyde dehydrogenase family protein [Boseongicola sp.]